MLVIQEAIKPLIAHIPLVFWLLPAFGDRGAGWFLGTTEWTFGLLLFLGFWNKPLGILGAAGSLFTYATISIISFLPDAWAPQAGGFQARYCPGGALERDGVAGPLETLDRSSMTRQQCARDNPQRSYPNRRPVI